MLYPISPDTVEGKPFTVEKSPMLYFSIENNESFVYWALNIVLNITPWFLK